jgi:hypothetical protein
MVVHFIASRNDILNNIGNLRKIVEAIHEEGHTLAHDWVEPTYQLVKKGTKVVDLDYARIHKESLESIYQADVVIADSSLPSFSVGYQVAMSLQMKKPILVINKDDVSKSPFPTGIDGLLYKKYNEKDIKQTVIAFLKENDIQLKDMRFNFFIDRPIYNYLRWASFKTGKTKAEILRDLVSKEIDKKTHSN